MYHNPAGGFNDFLKTCITPHSSGNLSQFDEDFMLIVDFEIFPRSLSKLVVGEANAERLKQLEVTLRPTRFFFCSPGLFLGSDMLPDVTQGPRWWCEAHNNPLREWHG